ncbi:hypothetical protein BVRB_2g031640 [Beta vulgaris subsp. vulgaris]|uniref:Uncharacterized protein n=1 Tax=Beta vulgaris subsp. vulgaris TaxID=3555 RepID=A0A0J8CWN5_BETVV|nr:hypothetical protein BVRB_2g031640 [Beta vulgaris subsp. vulgaris]
MAEGVISDLVAKALELLATSTFKKASSWWGARDDLKKLGKSMEMIQARVRDAEKYQEEEGSDAIKLWLRRLKLVLYQAGDLFDRILTVDSQKQRRKQNHKVHFFLRSSSPVLNWKIAGKIKSIRKQLDAINSDMAGLNLPSYQHRVGPSPQMALLMNNRATTPFVEAEDVIGRECDKDKIIEMLFDPKYDAEKVTIIPIMGFGGIGKTTLAQFAFSDQRVQNHFFPLKWAYVPEKNDRNAVMGKIFNSFTDSMPALNLMGNLHIKFCKQRNDAVLEAQRANLKGSQRLSNLTLDYRELAREKATPSSSGMNKMLMYLQLPPNLIYLRVGNYSGDKMQCRWLDVLSKLDSIIISECNTCKTLPHLSQLPHLKNLYLERLDALEYVEDEDDIWVGEDCGYAAHYFPALENLELDGLPQLKRWTRPSKSGGEQRRQLFPRLFQMKVCNCKELVSIPLAPKLVSLKVSRGNAKLFESNLVLHDDIPCKWLVGLSKIVSISISGCNNCTVLPHMSHLPLLKKVYLERLDGLEYVEDEDDILGDGDCGYTSHYFPALEKLNLINLPQLKKWTRPSKSDGEQRQQRKLLFPHLLHMEVKDCKELVLMPLAPKLESLEVFRSNEKLFESNLASPNKEASSSLFTSLKHLRIDGTKDSLSISSRLCKLESVEITHGMELRSLMIESPSSIRDLQLNWVNSGFCNILKGDFPFIEKLTIWVNSEELEEGNTSTYWQGLRSLRSLELGFMKNLKKLPPGIACLTNLQALHIAYMENLTALPDEIGNLSLLQELTITCMDKLIALPEEIDNLSLLQKLTIARMDKLIALPEEIGNLSKLSYLEINYCPELRVLPLSLQGLTSLQELVIEECPHLEERYSVKFHGRDRHLLQHIPDLQFSF